MKSIFSSLAVAATLLGVQAAHFDVNVGKNNQLKFEPETLIANRGDTITYHFFAKNHSVTQSSFDSPCSPLASGGFFSAFVPATSDSECAKTVFTITGMLHSINPPSSGNTFDAFRDKAKGAGPSSSPPDGLPVGGKRFSRVDVGLNGALTFTPNDIKEPPRTFVEFSFNPRNHSVTQSSFDKPCEPSANGFSSGLIPTALSPSGVTFSILVNDSKPIWFYCAQITGTHCQKGMVEAINAPDQGNTLQAFTNLASKAPPSTLPPMAPLGGVLRANRTILPMIYSAVVNVSALTVDMIAYIPKPGDNDQFMMGKAGGGATTNWNFGTNISDAAFLDNILLKVLFEGYESLHAGGKWANVYPETIVETIGTMAAQAWVHRGAATDSLQHFSKTVLKECAYAIPDLDIDAFLSTTLTILLLEIGLIIDATALLAPSDPWLIPALATSLGAKSRMTAVLNLMQNHIAAAAPREVSIPAELVYSYAMHHYVSSCPDKLAWDKPFTKLDIKGQGLDQAQRLMGVDVQWEGKHDGDLFLAWLGAWGEVKFSSIADGKSSVPDGLCGHVWAVVTSKKDIKASEIAAAAIAGPEMVWVTEP
ncbi:hypothetical protein GQ607_002842 [Colletotrichum asianum]|uniref:Extracellular serine-rich protein n=1 Tax=Colletotrichum asianum TaxID=702518 RepID=A0A8H3WPP5_9PEZI|nr:hypothetical protein GQ607_002842 [Colletotrichum asianum]